MVLILNGINKNPPRDQVCYTAICSHSRYKHLHIDHPYDTVYIYSNTWILTQLQLEIDHFLIGGIVFIKRFA